MTKYLSLAPSSNFSLLMQHIVEIIRQAKAKHYDDFLQFLIASKIEIAPKLNSTQNEKDTWIIGVSNFINVN